LIKALSFLKDFILVSTSSFQEKQLIPVQPFRLDEEASTQPSEFSIDFLCEGVRFNYRIALTPEQVITEELHAFPKKYSQTWFSRAWNAVAQSYDWYYGPNFKGEHKAWEQMTRSNALYLTTAVQFNSEQLKPIWLWFKDKLIVLFKNGVVSETTFNPDLTLQFLKDPTTRPLVQKFMECADIGIEEFRLVEEKPGPVVQTRHKNVFFDLSDESDGTQRLFVQAGGWLQSLREGLVLCVDEVGLHLHPHIVRYLIELFNNSKTNPKNGQLILTTHDTSLLDSELFRRDQIWFMQKDEQQSSRLYSLLEFKPRKEEAFDKGYLKGRYGALPFTGSFRF